MRKTSGNKTIAQRKQAAKIMNGKRATKDLLVNTNIRMDNICDMCGDNKKETNRHIHRFCRGKEIVESRTKVKSEMIKLISDCGGDRKIQGALGQLFDVTENGEALNLRNEKHLPPNFGSSVEEY